MPEMSETPSVGRSPGIARSRRPSRGDPRIALGLILALIFAVVLYPITLLAQTAYNSASTASPLPPATGDPLTITPRNYPEVVCTVVDWNPQAAKPALGLLCPPQEVFAPLRVYIKLSWLKPEDIPHNPFGIQATPKTQTKLRTSKNAAQVWLKVYEPNSREIKPGWVSFNGVMDVALLADNHSR
jgi:hypothetical protein